MSSNNTIKKDLTVVTVEPAVELETRSTGNLRRSQTMQSTPIENQTTHPSIIVNASINMVAPTEKDLYLQFIHVNKTHLHAIEDLTQEQLQLKTALDTAIKMLLEQSPKKYITVKELTRLYSISESQQKNLRNRIKDPLPYHQEKIKGKIRYLLHEIEEWFQQTKVS